ncbi:MAG: protein kinase [Gimesia sp.]|nr:protein kinase [Gimesia sp.]
MEIYCPHCNHPVDYSADEESKESKGVLETVHVVDCPNCGSVNIQNENDFTQSFVPNNDSTQTFLPETEFCKNRQVGHFVLKRRLGKGAFGEVWLADDLNLQREIALKLPNASLENRSILLHEAQSAAILNHPNIVSVYEVGALDDQVYIASEYIDGITLADSMSAGIAPFEKSVALLTEVAFALDHAHNQGIIHRDIKPANILLNQKGEPFVTDFGLAKRNSAEQSISSEGQILGTARYMSPEQACGNTKKTDHRSDVYALGVVLFEMMTGYSPFRGNVRAVIHNKINEDAPSPRGLDSKIPKDLETICLKCLEREPASRYQTAGELALEFQRYTRNEPIVARPISALAKTWRWRQRRPLVANLLFGLFASLVLGIVGIGYYSIEATQNANQNRKALYRSNMNLASEYFAKGDYAGVKRIVDQMDSDQQLADVKGFEWYFFKNFLSAIYQTVHQGDPVGDVALSHDGRLLAALGTDRVIRVWETEEMQLIRTLSLDAGRFHSIEFSLNTQRLISGSSDGYVRVWNPAENSLPILEAKHGPAVHFVKVSPDGKQILTAGQKGAIRIWELASLSLIQDIPSGKGGVADICFSADSNFLVVASQDGLTRRWNLDDASINQLIEVTAHTKSKITKVSISDNGKILLTGHYDGQINFWSVETGNLLYSYNTIAGLISDMTFLADTSIVAVTGSTGIFFLYDIDQKREVRRLVTHNLRGGKLSHSQNGKYLAVGSGAGSVKLLNCKYLLTPAVFWHDSNTLALKFTGQGTTFIAGSTDGTVRRWDYANGQATTIIDGNNQNSNRILLMDVQPGGHLMATVGADNLVTIRETSSGNLIHQINPIGTVITSLKFSNSGKLLALTTDQQILTLYQTENWENSPIEFEISEGKVTDLSFTSDDHQIAIANRNGEVLLANVELETISDRKLNLEMIPYSLTFCASTGLLAIGTESGEIFFWKGQTDLPIDSILAHSGRVAAMQVFSNGKTLVSAGRDGEIKLWDIETRELTSTLIRHRRLVFDLAISADDRTLISGGLEGDIRIWNAVSY